MLPQLSKLTTIENATDRPLDTFTSIFMDYDGCGCILNLETVLGKLNASKVYEPFLSEGGFPMGSYATFANQYLIIPFAFARFKQLLEHAIASHRMGSPRAELRSVSSRQSEPLDAHAAVQKNNGSCVEVFSNYARTNGLEYCAFVTGEYDKLKGKLFIKHLQHLATEHPNEALTVAFFDDNPDKKIFPKVYHAVKQAYAHPDLKGTLPIKFKIILHQFDWYPILIELINLSNKGLDLEALKKRLYQLEPQLMNARVRSFTRSQASPVAPAQAIEWNKTASSPTVQSELNFFNQNLNSTGPAQSKKPLTDLALSSKTPDEDSNAIEYK